MLRFDRLVSGGIITNYNCSSKCGHCVYASSPKWPRDYMDAETTSRIFSFLRDVGVHCVHIGGGEPLLYPEKLFIVLEEARKKRIQVEYVETNSSWFSDETKGENILKRLQSLGVGTLLISIDPFHNEYIPFNKVKGLMEACRRTGMDVFPWLMDFWKDLEKLDPAKTHSLEEYEQVFGSGYKVRLAERYRLNMRGRALETYKAHLKKLPLDRLLAQSAPCRELNGVHHFHIDLYGKFIPQSCAGLAVDIEDLKNGTSDSKYELINTLAREGVKGLYSLASDKYGFEPESEYGGKCHLCYEIRKYLVRTKGLDTADLKPTGHYAYM